MDDDLDLEVGFCEPVSVCTDTMGSLVSIGIKQNRIYRSVVKH
jgi:hypothetical protein